MSIAEVAKGLSKALTPILGGAGKELSGYLADHIRFFRWKSAVRIIERANEFSKKKKIDPKKVPIKFIVPFLEAASLEDTARGAAITDMWASLLASTIDKHQSRHTAYIDVLRRLSPKEAKFLLRTYKMITEADYLDEDFDPDLSNVGDKRAIREDFGFGFEKSAATILKRDLQARFEWMKVAEEQIKSIVKDICYRVDLFPILYEVGIYEGRELTGAVTGPLGKVGLDVAANLTVLGLMDRFEVEAQYPSRAKSGKVVRGAVSFVVVTSLGFDFMKTCCSTRTRRDVERTKHKH
jgi:hypothetical protein